MHLSVCLPANVADASYRKESGLGQVTGKYEVIEKAIS